MTARLGIGTAQFGLDYGISNTAGRCSPEEVARILGLARSSGVRVLDTAAAYGTSEEVLGQTLGADHPFAIVTKTPAAAPEVLGPSAAGWLERAFERSLSRLRQERVYGLLLHRAEDLLGPAGECLFDAMLRLKRAGRVARIGVSVYDGGQVDAVRARFPLDLVQLPLSVLDQRVVASGQLARLAAAGVEVHARSAFLQGLLLMEPVRLPPFFDRFRPRLHAFREAADAAGLTPLEAALSFVLGLDGVDDVIVGVTSAAELSDLLAARHAGPASFDVGPLACADEDLVNPSRWRLP